MGKLDMQKLSSNLKQLFSQENLFGSITKIKSEEFVIEIYLAPYIIEII